MGGLGGGWGVHIIIKKHFALLNMCCSKLSKFWKIWKEGFFLGGGGEGSTLHIMTKNCTALSVDCVVACCI